MIKPNTSLKKVLLSSCCIFALGISSCAPVNSPTPRNVDIPAPSSAKERPESINEGYDPITYVPLGPDVLVPKRVNEEELPKIQVGPIEFRGETLASALQLVLEDYNIPLAFESEEGLTRQVTVSALRGDLTTVVNKLCSLANMYCGLEDGILTIKDTETFAVTLPPIGDDSVLDSIGEGIEAITGDSPVIDSTTRTMIYTATQRSARQAMDYFQRLRANTALVVFETYIWEVQLDGGNTSGIQWDRLEPLGAYNIGIDINGTASANVGTPISIGLPTRGTVDFDNGDVINFLSSQGSLKTISQPQISVLSGSEATLRVAETINYIESLSRTTDEDGDETVSTSTGSVDTGFTLTIGSSWDDSTVYGDIEIELDEFLGFEQFEAGAGNSLQLPRTSERDLNTNIRVRPGDSVLIAGLVREQDEFDTEGPGFNKPIFPSSRTATTSNSELVFLLRPRVIAYIPENERLAQLDAERAVEEQKKTQSLLRKVMSEKSEAEKRLLEVKDSLKKESFQKSNLMNRLESSEEMLDRVNQERQMFAARESELQDRLQAALAENQRYQNELRAAEQLQEEQARTVKTQELRLNALLNEKQTLQSQIANAEARVAKAQQELSDATNGSVQQAKLEQLRKALIAARDEQSALLKKLENSDQSVEKAKTDLGAAIADNKRAEDALEAAQERAMSLAEEKAAIEVRLNEAQDKLSATNEETAKIQAEKEAIQQQLDVIKSALREVGTEKVRIETELEKAKAQASGYEEELEKLRNNNTEKESKIQELMETLNEAKAENTEIQQNLQSSLDEVKKAEESLLEAETVNESKKEEVQKLIDDLDNAEQERDKLIDDLNESRKREQDFEETLTKVRTGKELTEKELDAVKNHLTQVLEEKIAIQDDLAHKLAQIREMRSEVKVAQQMLEIEKTNTSVLERSLDMALADKEEALAKLKKSDIKIAELNEQISGLRIEVAEAKAELAESEQMVAQITTEKQAAEDALVASNAALEETKAQVENKEAVIANSTEIMRGLKGEKEKLEALLAEAEAKIKSEQDAIKMAQSRLQEKEKHITKSAEFLDSLEKEKQALRDELKLAQQQAKEKEAENAELMEKLALYKKQLGDAEEKLAMAEEGARLMDQRLQDAEKKIASAQSDSDQLENKLAQAKEKERLAQEKLAAAQAEKITNAKDIRKLQLALKVAEEEKQEAKVNYETSVTTASSIKENYIVAMRMKKKAEQELREAREKRDILEEKTIKFGSLSADLLNPGAM